MLERGGLTALMLLDSACGKIDGVLPSTAGLRRRLKLKRQDDARMAYEVILGSEIVWFIYKNSLLSMSSRRLYDYRVSLPQPLIIRRDGR
jgi:hypothetical protein